MSRVPDGGIDAIGVLFECTNTSRTIESPKLDGVIPRGSDEGVSPSGIVVNGVNFAGVLLEGSERILGWRKSGVEELNRAVSDSSD